MEKESTTDATTNKRGVKTFLIEMKDTNPELYGYMQKFAELETTGMDDINYIMGNLKSIVALYDVALDMALQNERYIHERAVKFNKVYKRYNIRFKTPNEGRILKRFLIANNFVKKITDREHENRYQFLDGVDVETFRKGVKVHYTQTSPYKHFKHRPPREVKGQRKSKRNR
jgi:hypothetical protein